MSTFINITLDPVGDFGTSNNGWYWTFQSTDVANTTHTYKMRNSSTVLPIDFYISYNWTTHKWFDTDGQSLWWFADTANATNVTSRESSANLQKIYLYSGINQYGGSHTNPYYDPDWPPEEPATGTEGTSSTSVSYIVADNELRIVISPDEETTDLVGGSANANRQIYYQLRKVSGTNFFQGIVHTQGWVTNHIIVPPSPGTYLLEKVRTNPLDYHSFNSVEVTQAQLDAWHSANNGHIFYDPSENYLHYFIHSSEDTTNLLFGSSGRELFYRVRSIGGQFVHNFNHLHDYDTNGTYRPTAHGIYHLERVLTNPSEVLSYAYAEVTQSQLDAWNLLNAPPGDDSGNNTPPNTPRGRRGNHNFW